MQTRDGCREDLSRIQEATSSGAPVDALLLVYLALEKSKTNAISVNICILSSRKFEDTLENTVHGEKNNRRLELKRPRVAVLMFSS